MQRCLPTAHELHVLLVQGMEHYQPWLLHGGSNKWALHSILNSVTDNLTDNYTTPIQAVIVILTILMAWSSDTFLQGRRWPVLVFASTSAAIIFLSLARTPVFPTHRAGRLILYYLSGFCQASSSLFWAWTQDTLSGDPATRAFASGGLNVWAYVADATIPLGIFQTVDQPGVVAGNYGAAGFAILHPLTALTLGYVQHTRKQKQVDTDEHSNDNNTFDGQINKSGPTVGTLAV